jgi:hypothetical protein
MSCGARCAGEKATRTDSDPPQVTQPRRVTATSVAARVAEEMGEVSVARGNHPASLLRVCGQVCGARGALTGYQVALRPCMRFLGHDNSGQHG